MVSIMILSLAILPMAGMFDMGLKTATTGSNYDKGRTLANLKMEEAKSLSFDTLRNNFPEVAPTTTTYTGSGNYQSAWKSVSGPATADFTNFQYMVTKQYMTLPSQTPGSSSENFTPSGTATDLIRITVTVRFPNDGGAASPRYTTYGLVTR